MLIRITSSSTVHDFNLKYLISNEKSSLYTYSLYYCIKQKYTFYILKTFNSNNNIII